MKKISVLLLPLLIIGCAHSVKVESKADFRCGNNDIYIEMLEDDTAVLKMNGISHVLNRVVTASGVKYESTKSKIIFRNKENDAYLSVGDEVYPTCVKILK